MTDERTQSRATDQFQQLGLREYEAKCFVALTGLESGTAREVSERIDVPRTRVYEAVRVLESEGLVEIQHSSPQRFRAVPVAEAVSILTHRYESRLERLEASLREVESTRGDRDSQPEQEVWAVRDPETIATRSESLLNQASDEVFLLLGHEDVLGDRLLESLQTLEERAVTVVVGTATEALADRVESVLQDAEVFVSDLGWFEETSNDEELAVGRLLLVDGTTLLATTFHLEDGARGETGIYGYGFDNCLVLVVRRLLVNGYDRRD